MATVPNIKISTICLLLVVSIKLSSSGEYSGLLSRLYKKAAQNDRPLILVLDNTKSGKLKDAKVKNYQSSEQIEDISHPFSYLYQLAQSQKKTSIMKTPSKGRHLHAHEFSLKDLNKSKLRSRDRRDRLRSKDRRNRRETSGSKLLRSRSPVVNSLLRMANGLNCEAKNACENKCKRKNVRQKDVCEDKCEEEFECQEEEEEEKKDECDETEDECEDETTTDCATTDIQSTRGERLEAETNYCKRC